jgi:tetratricopeptide (TPR) repeat protein
MNCLAVICLFFCHSALKPVEDPLDQQAGVGMAIERALEAANIAFREGRTEAALLGYETVLQEAPRNRDALQMAGFIRYQALYLEDAEKYFLRALDPVEPSYYPLLMLGNIDFQRFRFQEALDFYLRAGALKPDDPTVNENIRLTEDRIERAGIVAELYRRSSLIIWIASLMGGGALLLILLLEVRASFKN